MMIGIDIGSNSIKVVELHSAGEQLQLKGIGEAMLPYGAITNKSVQDPKTVSSVLSNLVFDLKLKGKKAIVGVCGEAVASKIVSVSRNSLKKDMKKMSQDIVNKNLFKKKSGQINHSYMVLRQNEKRKFKEVPVLISGAKKNTVHNYKSCVAAANLLVQAVDMDSIALVNSWIANLIENRMVSKTALVNIGATVTSVIVIDKGIPCIVEDLNIGGEMISRVLIDKFKITYEEAERIKYSMKSYGRYEEITEVFENFAIQIANRINMVLVEQNITNVVLSGGCCSIKKVCELLTTDIDVSVEISNPFRNIAFSESYFDPEYVNYLAPKMAVATGLALRGL